MRANAKGLTDGLEMAFTLTLIDFDESGKAAIRASLDADVTIESFHSGSDEPFDPGQVVAIGPSCKTPVKWAERCHRTRADISVIIVASESREDAIRHAMSSSPYVGRRTRVQSSSDQGALGEFLIKTFQKVRNDRRQPRVPEGSESPHESQPPEDVSQRVLQHAPVGVATLSKDGIVLAWNELASKILQGTALQESVARAFDPRDEDEILAMIRHADDEANNDESHLFEVLRNENEIHFIEMRCARVDGSTRGDNAIVILQDVTPRVWADRQRARSDSIRLRRNRILDDIVGQADLNTILENLVQSLQDLFHDHAAALILVSPENGQTTSVASARVQSVFGRLEPGDFPQALDALNPERSHQAIPREPDPDWGIFGLELNTLGFSDLWIEPIMAANGKMLLGSMIFCGLEDVLPSDADLEEFRVFSRLASVAIERHFNEMEIRRHREHLEELVVLRTEELERRNDELRAEIVERARIENELRGAKELATSVIHDIGNVINSVNVATHAMRDLLGASHGDTFKKANSLLHQNIDDIQAFFREHPKGKLLPNLYADLQAAQERLESQMLEELDGLCDRIELIRDLGTSQLRLEKEKNQLARLDEVIDMALLIQLGMGVGKSIRVHKDLNAFGHVQVPKKRIAHVMLNLFKNAKEALIGLPVEQRNLSVDIQSEDTPSVTIRVRDTGIGIESDDLSNLFTYGFSTKSDGHGFGLHHCAQVVEDLGGSIRVESEGPGRGATFTVTLPPFVEEPTS